MGWTTSVALGPPPLTPEQLFPHVQKLRAYAVNKKLDMTDAFEEYAPSGFEKNLGIMDTARFKSVMGLLFGGELQDNVLQSICMHYGTNGLDAGGVDHVSTRWKQVRAVLSPSLHASRGRMPHPPGNPMSHDAHARSPPAPAPGRRRSLRSTLTRCRCTRSPSSSPTRS